MVLICIYLITNDVDHFILCLFAILYLHCELPKFSGFTYFLLSYKGYLCIFLLQILYLILLCKYSLSMWLTHSDS